MRDGDLLYEPSLQVEAVLIIHTWNWQSENAQIRIIIKYLSHVSIPESAGAAGRWGTAQLGRACHVAADEILKSRPSLEQEPQEMQPRPRRKFLMRKILLRQGGGAMIECWDSGSSAVRNYSSCSSGKKNS